MDENRDSEGRRLYKARGADGQIAWVDHDELWRLQQSQTESVRLERARRRRLVLLALAGLVALALVLAFFRWRLGIEPPQAGSAASVVATDPPAADAAAEALGATADGVAPPSLEAVAEVQPAAPATEQIAGAVRSWADAWERQDLPAYLASYSDRFTPAEDMSRSSWQELRRQRLRAPASIRVEIEQLEVAPGEDGRVEARFLQSYSSPSYSDVVRKSLELVEEDGDWRIVAERAETP